MLSVLLQALLRPIYLDYALCLTLKIYLLNVPLIESQIKLLTDDPLESSFN